jgi:hypothetical protein
VRRLIAVLASAIAIGFGIFTILGLSSTDAVLAQPTTVFLQFVVITVAVTVLIGVLNLLLVHLGRIRRRQGGWGYSVVLIVSTLGVIILTVLERANILQGQPSITTLLLEDVQVSIESALAGLLLFTLVYGAYRTMRNRITGWGLLFTIALILTLAGALPGITILKDIRDWLMDVPVSAGARGILLGIARGRSAGIDRARTCVPGIKTYER